jgi:hypothetical protein
MTAGSWITTNFLYRSIHGLVSWLETGSGHHRLMNGQSFGKGISDLGSWENLPPF